MNQQITEFIYKLPKPWQIDVCTQLNKVVEQSIPDVEERIQYGKPHYLTNKKYAAVIGNAKGWVTFTIFNAKDIDAPKGLFEAGDPDRRTIKIREGQIVDYDLLTTLLRQAVATL